MFKKILVPLDGSTLSEAVLPHVSQLAKTMGAEVVLLRVVPTQVTTPAYPALYPLPPSAFQLAPGRDMHGEAEGYLQRVAFDYFPDQNVSLQVAGGPAGDNILETASSLGVDLIAMTTHGRSGLSRIVLGSVADEVVRQSHLPVLLLRPSEQ
jgi:nucleotide-binding universal stress UspA family protein